MRDFAPSKSPQKTDFFDELHVKFVILAKQFFQNNCSQVVILCQRVLRKLLTLLWLNPSQRRLNKANCCQGDNAIPAGHVGKEVLKWYPAIGDHPNKALSNEPCKKFSRTPQKVLLNPSKGSIDPQKVLPNPHFAPEEVFRTLKNPTARL